jgi:hypothetical protein
VLLPEPSRFGCGVESVVAESNSAAAEHGVDEFNGELFRGRVEPRIGLNAGI